MKKGKCTSSRFCPDKVESNKCNRVGYCAAYLPPAQKKKYYYIQTNLDNISGNFITSNPLQLRHGKLIAVVKCTVVNEPISNAKELKIGCVYCSTSGKHVKVISIENELSEDCFK